MLRGRADPWKDRADADPAQGDGDVRGRYLRGKWVGRAGYRWRGA